jgi:MSHA biogenesis protein MshI
VFSFKANPTHNSVAGLTFLSDGIALAIVEQPEINPRLTHCEFYPCSSDEQLSQLTSLSKQFKLNDMPCNVVLSPDEYQVLQVDAPEVPKQELATALLWQVKDLVNYHVDDVVLEHVEMDTDLTSGREQILVLVCRKSLIEDYVELLKNASCQLNAIDTSLFSSRNLISRLQDPSTNDSIGLLNLWQDYCRISVLLNDGIAINRPSTINLDSLSFISDENGYAIIDSLALEIQRTFDYYERHSRQAPIQQLYIISNGAPVHDLAELFQSRLGIECILLDVADALDVPNDILLTNNCIAALGGALRVEQS